jgi:hypothetical protein
MNENKSIREEIDKYTFDPTSGDDLLNLGSSNDCMSPPKADLHPNIGKQGLKACYYIHELGLDIKC